MKKIEIKNKTPNKGRQKVNVRVEWTRKERRTLSKSPLFIAFFIIVCTVLLLIFSPNNMEVNAKQEAFSFYEGVEDLNSSVMYNWGAKALTAYKAQINEMIYRGYTKTQILDLLAIKSMECNRWDWLCYWIDNLDLWPFQINIIHKEMYNYSWELMQNKNSWELFLAQLTFAHWKIIGDEERYCDTDAFSYVGKTYNNENRFRCLALTYNWHPRYKYTYADLGWEKREAIKKWLSNNSNFLTYNYVNK